MEGRAVIAKWVGYDMRTSKSLDKYGAAIVCIGAVAASGSSRQSVEVCGRGRSEEENVVGSSRVRQSAGTHSCLIDFHGPCEGD